MKQLSWFAQDGELVERSEELRTYLRQNIEYIVKHVNERFDESENEIITAFLLELLRSFTFPPSWKVCCWELVE